MFLGSFKTDFSGKNRLILPKKFRRELGNSEKFYLFLGQNGEIWGFNEENWQKQAEIILSQQLNTSEGRVERLRFFSRADECVLDGQGRFILPQEMVEKVNFKKVILLIGAGDHFEIWDLKSWEMFKNAQKV